MEKFIYNDGGRAEAGFKSSRAGDCVCRAVAIASGRPYREVWEVLAYGNSTQRITRRSRPTREETADKGIATRRKWFKNYMTRLGFVWVPTMAIGGGCVVHLKADELPSGRLVVKVSKHYVAVIDGVIHDTYNPDRNGTRCVYGYWVKK